MASTYTPIATQTLGSATGTVTFTSISGSYTDLVLVITGNTNNPTNPVLQFNGDTTTNYSHTYISGTGQQQVLVAEQIKIIFLRAKTLI